MLASMGANIKTKKEGKTGVLNTHTIKSLDSHDQIVCTIFTANETTHTNRAVRLKPSHVDINVQIIFKTPNNTSR